jgi:hypothetical protein
MKNNLQECLTHFNKRLRDNKLPHKRAYEKVLKNGSKAKRFVLTDSSIEINQSFLSSVDSLHLPFPISSIEFDLHDSDSSENSKYLSGLVLVVKEVSNSEIVINSFLKDIETNIWSFMFFDFTISLLPNGETVNGRRVKLDAVPLINNEYPEEKEFTKLVAETLFNLSIIVLKLMEFIYNGKAVVTEVSPGRINSAGVAGKPLKIDKYHMLTLTDKARLPPNEPIGAHASPREHDRHGFWRTSKLGKKHWVPATRVNVGIGGKIEKDYSIEGEK